MGNNNESYSKKMHKNEMDPNYKKWCEEFLETSAKTLKKNPDNISMRLLRAKINKRLNNLYEASEDYEYVLQKELNSYALSELFNIYYEYENYNQALKLIPMMYKSRCMPSYSIALCDTIIRKKLGLPLKDNLDYKEDYMRSQVIYYNEEEAIKYIKEYSMEKSEGIEHKPSFRNDVDIDALFYSVKENLKDNKKIDIPGIMEVHYFSISNVGTRDFNICNYLKVVVVPHTNNIVAIYPSVDCYIPTVTDLKYDHNAIFKEKEKVKTISQIDRFNKKYNKAY